MKKILIFACAFLFVAAVAFAAGPKTYQVTGPILEVNANKIVVKKGNEKWEINRDAATKVSGDLKVDSKVTIEYTMKAVSIEVKDAGKKAEPKKK
jgi:hypothetical protein